MLDYCTNVMFNQGHKGHRATHAPLMTSGGSRSSARLIDFMSYPLGLDLGHDGNQMHIVGG